MLHIFWKTCWSQISPKGLLTVKLPEKRTLKWSLPSGYLLESALRTSIQREGRTTGRGKNWTTCRDNIGFSWSTGPSGLSPLWLGGQAFISLHQPGSAAITWELPLDKEAFPSPVQAPGEKLSWWLSTACSPSGWGNRSSVLLKGNADKHPHTTYFTSQKGGKTVINYMLN